MNFKGLFISVLLLSSATLFEGCGIKGCMDPLALNYDAEATKYDGSCEYGELQTYLLLKSEMEAGGESVIVNQEFSPENMNKTVITRLRFYLADISLRETGGSKLSLSDVELIEMDSAKFDLGFSNELRLDVPAGNYDQLDFDLGVPDNFNSVLPADYEEGHPLSVEDLFWVWATKRKFVEIDGRYDYDGDGIAERPFFFHTGLQILYRDVNAIDVDFAIADGQKKELELLIDLDYVFNQLNMDSLYQSHTNEFDANSMQAATMFQNAFSEAFSAK